MIANKRGFHSYLIRSILFLILAFGIVVLIGSLFLVEYEKSHADHIYPHVSVNGIVVGGMTKKEVISLFDKKSKPYQNVLLRIEVNGRSEATFSGKLMSIRFDSKSIADRSYLIGRSSYLPSRIYQQIMSISGFKIYDFPVHLVYDSGPLDDFIALAQEKYNKPAKNALFRFENGRVVSFRQEERGTEVDEAAFTKSVADFIGSLESTIQDGTIDLKLKTLVPETTLGEANEFSIEGLIGEGVSNYTHSIPGRIHNILLATSKFNGVLIPKGKEFSFNETVGDISSLTGYEQAYIIKEGKTVLGDGGGVCQVSTTLFRAALNAGLPITERLAHAYRVSYYENDSKPGFDATVFSPYADLKIKNDTDAAILIETNADQENNILTFSLYGKKDGRKSEISNITLYDVQLAPPPRYQDDPTLKKGVVKQVDFAAGGAKAKFDYKVTRGNETLFAKTFFSSYRPWQAVYLVGQAD